MMVAALAAAAVTAHSASAKIVPPANPTVALATYRTLIAQLPAPPNVVFDYEQTRSGPVRIVSERHRVYRNESGSERNETTIVNGTRIVPAIVRLYRRAAYPYGALRFLVDERYAVKLLGLTTVAGRRAYAYAVSLPEPPPQTGSRFSIDRLYLDVARLLPLRETFDVASAGCAGKGLINFAPAGRYWLAVSLRASCSPPTGEIPKRTYRDSIRFFGYRFPDAIPPEVFARGAPL